MMGRPETPDQMGLIPRSLDLIFQTIRSLQAQGREYTMQVLYVYFWSVTLSKFADYYNSLEMIADLSA